MPADPTSPWWYDTAAFAKLACNLAILGDDRPLGEFIREFRGLSATAKAKAIAAAVPGIRRVSDLAERPEACNALLRHMKDRSSQPKISVLGQVPEGHYREVLDHVYGTERYWYRHGGIVHRGVPWHIEVAIAETADEGAVEFAVNYAPCFGDPLRDTRLMTAEMSAYGAGSFLENCDAAPNLANDGCRAAVVHVTCAAPVFTDKGKTGLDVPGKVADVFAKVLWQAGRELYQEKRRADRADAAERRAAERARKEAERPRMTKKEAVFRVIPEAIRQQRGGTDLPFSSHSLFTRSARCS